MNPMVGKLEDRIRSLKADALARESWMQLRREIERHGGRWDAPNGMVFLLRDGAIHQYLADAGEGVGNLVITALDAPEPYVAELHVDLQAARPQDRARLLEDLAHEQLQRAQLPAPARDPGPPVELVTIVEGDWLSKITKKRWGTTAWRLHLQPTAMTIASREVRGRKFHEDLIYPGDTFEVVT